MTGEVRWAPVPDGPGYEVSWDGDFRSLDRQGASGRHLRGQSIATTASKDGYVLVKYVNGEGKRVTRQLHRVQLEAFVFRGPIPEGVQSRHWDDNPSNNRWRPGTEEESRKAGGNLFTGNGSDQHRDKVRNNGGKPLPVPPPAHDCINHAQCGGKTRNPGKRCYPCVQQVGRDAGDMLRNGENLMRVALHFGYQKTDWVYKLAVEHGGYRGTKEQAHAQGRKWSQRVAATVRNRLGRGRSASPQERQQAKRTAGRAGETPYGRPSLEGQLRQPGQTTSQVVTERKTPERTPEVTERSHVPYPADQVRIRGGTSRRGRR